MLWEMGGSAHVQLHGQRCPWLDGQDTLERREDQGAMDACEEPVKAGEDPGASFIVILRPLLGVQVKRQERDTGGHDLEVGPGPPPANSSPS